MNFPLAFAFVASAFMFTSCGDETDTDDLGSIFDTDTSTITTPDDYDLKVNATNADSGERTLEIEAVPGSTITVNFVFTSGDDDKKMRRVYGTSYTYGDLEVAEYEFGDDVDTKADGSLDIESADGYEFNQAFTFTVPALDAIDHYNFWVTNARGDYRDVSNSNAISGDAYGSITIKGAAAESLADIADASAVINSFTAKVLAAPLADGTSESFISLFDGETHTINSGEEFLAYWDFGYVNDASGASFYSVSDYPEYFKIGTDSNGDDILGHVYEFVGADASELNSCYFSLSSLTASEFDAITDASELDYITNSLTENVTNLVEGSVVEFVDKYGNKGLIKVTEIEGTYKFGDYIEFDVKVQVNYSPIIL